VLEKVAEGAMLTVHVLVTEDSITKFKEVFTEIVYVIL
jgi:hypothetical protein